MQSHYRVAIIGGGVVGASVAYHLAKLGWTDVALFERNVLTAGSSWHAAGGFHALNADPNIAALQSYTIDLLSEIEAESGQNIGMHMTGGISIASAPERWEWLQSTYRVFQTMGISDVHLVGPEEIKKLCPIVSIEGVLGGLYAGREGHIDPSGVVHAYARSAKKRGATIIEHNRVLELTQRPDKSWNVVTEKGTVIAEHVVNAGGLWAKQIGRMAGIDLPVTPMEHHYLVTESIPEIAALDHELPMIVDLEGFTYMRQEQKGLLLGIYETDYRHWNMDGAPWDFGIELIQEDTDRIASELTLGFERFPCLQTAGIKRWVNGAFTFSPDGNPLVGPVRGVPNYWVACGVMAGFLQGGGVGKSLAEWMVHGEPEADIFGMDIARYGDFASNREYIRQTTGQFYSRRFVMSYPNEQLPAGRPLRTPPAFDAMTAAGARWGTSWGLEIPLYFADPDFVEKPSLKRSNADTIIGAEVAAVRQKAGLLDTSAFSRYRVSGPGAQGWLDRTFACRLPKPGQARLAPMLSDSGKLKGDLTLFNWGDGSWWIMGSYYLRHWHMRWFESHLSCDVTVDDISDDFTGFALSGPASREILQSLTHQNIARSALPFMGCDTIDIGLIRARVARLSITGELGYEINCRAFEHATLRRILLDAGKDAGLREIGYGATNALRLEKSFGIWSREFTQAYTPSMTGLERFIAFDKGDFVGREAALAERNAGGAARVLVTLEVDATDADASGYEPVWKEDSLIGYITSGGYVHTLGKSIALALVDRQFAAEGMKLVVHVVGQPRAARIIPNSPYDPAGRAMRS
ncbi:GcvT family protein [Rhizobium rhododendri]|uniref:FAD-dependent oxidoreductase n=1 Tax=Rhizobium rhododendri TaxID=2506430 RepID=A0ABY8IRS6_9HYPH|nr:FAD-dependent oxidoreductase [Rhizobium rhododendri]WFS25594.1 FAD-dependent oxidoreductase [Rhizobium rhododendri]